ncbi:MAG: ABC transporter ATP-binding protein [Lachnospiraceae bacterium]
MGEKENIRTKGLSIRNVNKSFQIDGGELKVLKDINLDIKPQEFVSIVGFSGCGKSTLLRIIGGLETATSGEVLVNEKKVDKPGLDRGMIFQESRLFPWFTVEKNIAYGLSHSTKKEMGKKEVDKAVDEMLELVQLEKFKNVYPKQLSGGMQQRVSIARSLISKPDVLLLDEPFSALDAITRIDMQNEILKIWDEEKTTMILVTHDIDEAIYLSDRVVILSNNAQGIKKIVNIGLSRPRKRTGIEFMEVRRKIYKEFFNENEDLIEYII